MEDAATPPNFLDGKMLVKVKAFIGLLERIR
jgi:hypothetical protein